LGVKGFDGIGGYGVWFMMSDHSIKVYIP